MAVDQATAKVIAQAVIKVVTDEETHCPHSHYCPFGDYRRYSHTFNTVQTRAMVFHKKIKKITTAYVCDSNQYE